MPYLDFWFVEAPIGLKQFELVNPEIFDSGGYLNRNHFGKIQGVTEKVICNELFFRLKTRMGMIQ